MVEPVTGIVRHNVRISCRVRIDKFSTRGDKAVADALVQKVDAWFWHNSVAPGTFYFHTVLREVHYCDFFIRDSLRTKELL